MGISAQRLSTFTWAAAAVLGGLGGILSAPLAGGSAPASSPSPRSSRPSPPPCWAAWPACPAPSSAGWWWAWPRAWPSPTRSSPTSRAPVGRWSSRCWWSSSPSGPGACSGRGREGAVTATLSAPSTALVRPGRCRDDETRPTRGLGHARRWRGLAALVLVLPLSRSAVEVNIFTEAVIYAIIGLSLNVLLGYAGQISLGPPGVRGGGRLHVGLHGQRPRAELPRRHRRGRRRRRPPGPVLGLVSLRVTGLYFALVSLAYGTDGREQPVQHHVADRRRPPGQAAPKPSAFASDYRYYYLCLAFLAMVLYVDWRLTSTKTGRSLLALRQDNPKVAESFGTAVKRYTLIAFVISGVFASLAGALLAHNTTRVVSSQFEFRLALVFVIMTVVGGLRSRVGVVVGSAFFSLTDYLFEKLHLSGAINAIPVLPDLSARSRPARRRPAPPHLHPDPTPGRVRGDAPSPRAVAAGRTCAAPGRVAVRPRWEQWDERPCLRSRAPRSTSVASGRCTTPRSRCERVGDRGDHRPERRRKDDPLRRHQRLPPPRRRSRPVPRRRHHRAPRPSTGRGGDGPGLPERRPHPGRHGADQPAGRRASRRPLFRHRRPARPAGDVRRRAPALVTSRGPDRHPRALGADGPRRRRASLRIPEARGTRRRAGHRPRPRPSRRTDVGSGAGGGRPVRGHAARSAPHLRAHDPDDRAQRPLRRRRVRSRLLPELRGGPGRGQTPRGAEPSRGCPGLPRRRGPLVADRCREALEPAHRRGQRAGQLRHRTPSERPRPAGPVVRGARSASVSSCWV